MQSTVDMFGANVKGGRGMMQSILCPNGNCTQINCLLRHLHPPSSRQEFDVDENGYRRGISDRAEQSAVENSLTARQADVSDSTPNDEMELIAQVMEESRRIAYTCIYCGLEMSDGNSLQLHYVNCAEIGHDEELVSQTPKEPQKSWKEQEEEEDKEREKNGSTGREKEETE